MKNLERYKNDLEKLIKTGETLVFAMCREYQPNYANLVKEEMGDEKGSEYLRTLPSFSEKYESWYSEAKTLIQQLLPDRLQDFVAYYEKPKNRKKLTYGSYRISDSLMRLCIQDGLGGMILGPDAAIPRFRQQLAIVKAVRDRFESSLFDIRKIVQADLFDSELEAAKALINHGFLRAAGALAGVVMEKHLGEICQDHSISICKKNPTIADFNEALKKKDVIDVPQWRFNQRLADIRNLCTHNKERKPSENEVLELVEGVEKITKTLF